MYLLGFVDEITGVNYGMVGLDFYELTVSCDTQ